MKSIVPNYVYWILAVSCMCVVSFQGCNGIRKREKAVSGQEYSCAIVEFLRECKYVQDCIFAPPDDFSSSRLKQFDTTRIRLTEKLVRLISSGPISGTVYMDDSQIIELLFGITGDIAAKQTHEETIYIIENSIKQWRWLFKDSDVRTSGYPLIDFILPGRKNDCAFMSREMMEVLTTLGIESYLEYTPLWQNRPKSHYWCVAKDSLGILQPFTPPANNLREDWESDLIHVGKVYRIENKPCREVPFYLAKKGEYIPDIFQDDRISDQTDRYHHTSSVRLPLDVQVANRLSYLCFYDNNEDRLSPVGWGTINTKGRFVTYKKVPHHILFFPVIYVGRELTPIGDPFIVDSDGRIHQISKQGIEDDMRLFRKFPEKKRLVDAASNLIGASILAGNERKGPYDTLGRITQFPIPYAQDIKLIGRKSYRYYKISTAHGQSLNLAEAQLLAPKKTCKTYIEPIALPSFGPNDNSVDTSFTVVKGELLPTGKTVSNAIDGDVLSYTGSSDMFFYFKAPVCVTTMRFLPRNANNIIEKGDDYILYYYDGGWLPFAEERAQSNCIHFRNVPANTIYLLSNVTKGEEEFPFYYLDGRQVFVNSQRMYE